MNNDNMIYWIWLSERFGIASKSFPRLAERYIDPYDVYRLDAEEIEQLEGIDDKTKAALGDKSLDSAYSILKYCKKNEIDVIGYGDSRYPVRLRAIEDPPVLLYCIGKLPNMNEKLCIGMVGTRKMSEYGKQSAYKISYELTAAGACVVSGMALGIDGVCACGALESGGATVAVLGCGLSIAYPKEHAKLMRMIAKKGAVVSEYPPFERPLSYNFPKRNRIISGMCQGVVIVEGAVGSGALITASRAISQGREVFALPGKVDESNSEGPNQLIKDGANVACKADDIIAHYDFLYHDVISYRGLSRAKKSSELFDTVLKKYGVASADSRMKKYSASEQKRDEEKQMKTQEQTNTAVAKTESCEPATADRSSDMLDALDDSTKRVYALLPDGTAFTPDTVSAQGIDIGEVITALTMLEISGLVSSLPGGLYMRK